MVRHVVMWKFRPEEQARKRQFLDGLRGLYGVIEEIRHIEVKEAVPGTDGYDAILLVDFDNMDDLRAYRVDPRHKAVAAICKEIRTDRASVDYEL